MAVVTYEERRSELEAYFDRTAVEAWARLTSEAPLGRIRATVRAGRERMRTTLLGWVPGDLRGARVLDAGCGTGAAAIALAERGAEVIAVDLSTTLLDLARRRAPRTFKGGSVTFVAGDMLDARFGRFDHVIAMDSLIHYTAADATAALALLGSRTSRSIAFTFAPRTTVLAMMHAAGRMLPHADRAPAIEPVREAALRRLIGKEGSLAGWRVARSQRIKSGFYTSQALELCAG
jgi:magnesium-protoporphyrin O-methyltransferase